jgi:hypothetical protein
MVPFWDDDILKLVWTLLVFVILPVDLSQPPKTSTDCTTPCANLAM